jgi:hypothetical protein
MMPLGDDRDLRARIAHISRLIAPLTKLQAPLDLPRIYMDSTLASAELEVLCLLIRARWPQSRMKQ